MKFSLARLPKYFPWFLRVAIIFHSNLLMISCSDENVKPEGLSSEELNSEGKTADSRFKSRGDYNCESPMEDPVTSAATSVLKFSVEESIAPCGLKAYVVGDELNSLLRHNVDGSYYIEGIQPGKKDIIVIAGNLAVGLTVSVTEKGSRLNGIELSRGSIHDSGLLELQKMGSINGSVSLELKSEFDQILVYIPGTSFSAFTDASGNFQISNVPPGVHNLYYDFDGYRRGQIEQIEVLPNTGTTAEHLHLLVDTGATGFIRIGQGSGIATSVNVILNIGATDDAVLMKISLDDTFIDVPWEPIQTTKNYSFVREGIYSLYIKFANDNGLASGTYQSSVKVDATAPAVSISSDFDGRSNKIPFAFSAGNEIAGIKSIKYSATANMKNSSIIAFSESMEINHQKEFYFEFTDFAGRTQTIHHIVSFVPTLSQARTFLNVTNDETFSAEGSCTSLGDRVFFAGGNDYGPFFDTVDIYNKKTNKWSVAQLSVARDNIAALSIKSKAIFVGGTGANYSRYKTVDIYNDETNLWTNTEIPVEGKDYGIFGSYSQDRNLAYFLYQINSSSSALTCDYYTFDPEDDSFTSVTIDATVSGFSCELVTSDIQDTLIEVPAYSWSLKEFFFQTYNTQTGQFTRRSIPAEPVVNWPLIRAVSFGSKVAFLTDNQVGATTGLVSMLYIYDLDTDTYISSEIPTARFRYYQFLGIGNEVLLSGGFQTQNTLNHVDRTDVFNVDTETWTSFPLKTSRWLSGSVAFDGKVFFAGGTDYGKSHKVIDIYDTQTRTMLGRQ